jgi:hypothetical protein
LPSPALDLARGVPCRAPDYIVDWHPHVQELGHDVEHAFHAGVHAADVQVSGYRVGHESLLDGGHGLAKQKAASAMAHIENHAAFAGFKQVRPYLASVVQHRDGAQVHVGGNVTGPELFENQVLIRPLGATAEIHHHRNIG